MREVTEQQMAERLAPESGPGRAAAEAQRQSQREHQVLERAAEEQQRYGNSALATLATAWLNARQAVFGADALGPEDAAELRLLASMSDRMATQAGVNCLHNLGIKA